MTTNWDQKSHNFMKIHKQLEEEIINLEKEALNSNYSEQDKADRIVMYLYEAKHSIKQASIVAKKG